MNGGQISDPFGRLLAALEPWLDQIVIVGGWAHRLYRQHPDAQALDYPPLSTQKLKQASEVRASEGMNLKKEAQILKREEFEFKKTIIASRKEVTKVVKSDPGDLKMAA